MSDFNRENEARQGEHDSMELGEFTRLKNMVLAGHRARSDWRKEARKAFGYVAGHQWSDEDKHMLDSQNRPAITFNRVAPIIKAVCGLEVNNRQGVVYIPREMGDVGVNETITAAGKWARESTYAEDEESAAFRNTTICGEGWTETRMEYDEDPQGKIVIENIRPLEMGVNAGACKPNYTDAQLIYRVRSLDIDEARVMLDLPQDLMAGAIDAKWMEDLHTPEDGGIGFKKDYPDETRAGINSDKRPPKQVRVIQVQYWVRERTYMVAQEGIEKLQSLNEEEFAKFQERAEAATLAGTPIQYQSTAVPQKVYYECFLLNSTMVGKRRMERRMFQFQAMTGEWDDKNKCFYGMLRDMFDPQMWANKWLSQTLHIMNSNAKGGLLAETDAFANQRKAEADWADPTKIVWVKPGTLQKQKIKERQPVALPQGLDQLMMFAISSIRDVTGVNLELLGQADREQAASLEMQRRQSAMTVLASLFDSLRRYRKYAGKLLLHFLAMLPEGTLIRVVSQDQYQYVPLMMDPDVEKYDVIIDEAPSSPDQKQFVWAITAQILQMGILPPAAIIELLKYSPYPETVVREIRKAMGMDGQENAEQLKQKLQYAEQALQVMEQRLGEAMENAKTAEDDRAAEMLKLEIDEYKAETDRLKVRLDAALSAQQNAQQVAAQAQTENVGDETSSASVTQNANAQVAALQEQVNQMSQMLAQLMQGAGGGQPAPEALPPITLEENDNASA